MRKSGGPWHFGLKFSIDVGAADPGPSGIDVASRTTEEVTRESASAPPSLEQSYGAELLWELKVTFRLGVGTAAVAFFTHMFGVVLDPRPEVVGVLDHIVDTAKVIAPFFLSLWGTLRYTLSKHVDKHRAERHRDAIGNSKMADKVATRQAMEAEGVKDPEASAQAIYEHSR